LLTQSLYQLSYPWSSSKYSCKLCTTPTSNRFSFSPTPLLHLIRPILYKSNTTRSNGRMTRLEGKWGSCDLGRRLALPDKWRGGGGFKVPRVSRFSLLRKKRFPYRAMKTARKLEASVANGLKTVIYLAGTDGESHWGRTWWWCCLVSRPHVIMDRSNKRLGIRAILG